MNEHQIVYLSIDSLVPNLRNSRTHSEKQLTKLANIIKEFGFNEPVHIAKDNIIICGHARIESAKRAGLKEIPTIYLGHLSDAQQKAYLIAHNKIALEAGWDETLLKEDLIELQEIGFDLELIAFDKEEIDKFIAIDDKMMGLSDPDAIPDLAENYELVTKLGDIWLLGEHRLMCGDSTMVDSVDRLFFDNVAYLCFTSPPYMDQRDYEKNINLNVRHIASFISSSFNKCEIYAINLGIVRKESEVITYWNDYIEEAKNSGLKLLSWNVWDKGEAGSVGNQTAIFAICHEFIFVFGKNTIELNKTYKNKYAGEISDHSSNRQRNGSIKKMKNKIINEYSQLRTVLCVTPQKSRDNINHPARFPLELPESYLLACTDANDYVYDPFGGSGTTIIACEKLNRRCLMMEISPLYCDIIIKRWEEFSGKKAINESTRLSFEEIKNVKCI